MHDIEVNGFQPATLIDDRAISRFEQDQFAHGPIANQVAAIACNQNPPLSIGVFGPWGSGKSGLLSLIKHRVDEKNIPVVVLDAWKYAEAPLARQFVTQAAEQLVAHRVQRRCSSFLGKWGPDSRLRHRISSLLVTRAVARTRRRVWRQLYELRRVRRFRFRGVGHGLLGAAMALVVFGLVLVLGAAIRDLLIEASFEASLLSVGRLLGGAGPVVALAGFAGFAVTQEAERHGPVTEEEFESALEWVIRRAGVSDRVVFLVDELDRCTSQEVLGTLHTIRTFLGLPGSVFVVAGDREIVERSLESARSPATSSSGVVGTYSEGAGSFLDKVSPRETVG